MHIRFTALGIFQNVEEKIYFGVPSFTLNGKEIMNYAAYKKHVSIWLWYDMIDFLKNHYPHLSYTKATIQLSHKEDFPNELIKEICELVWEAIERG